MATMNISLPDPMRDWVEAQIKTGQYANNSDYLRDLIRKDQRNREKLKALQEAITQGFDSGRAGELDRKPLNRKPGNRRDCCLNVAATEHEKSLTASLSRTGPDQHLALFLPDLGRSAGRSLF